MKPYIDFQATITRDMLSSKKFKHRLIKYWGTTYVNGVHVFNKTYQFFHTIKLRDIEDYIGYLELMIR